MLYHLHRYCTDIPSGLKNKNKPPRTHLHDSLRSWRALFRSVAGPEGRKGKPVIGLSSVNGNPLAGLASLRVWGWTSQRLSANQTVGTPYSVPRPAIVPCPALTQSLNQQCMHLPWAARSVNTVSSAAPVANRVAAPNLLTMIASSLRRQGPKDSRTNNTQTRCVRHLCIFSYQSEMRLKTARTTTPVDIDTASSARMDPLKITVQHPAV